MANLSNRLASEKFARGAAAVLLALLALRTLWLLSIAWPYDTDDAYITLRYARHWAEGHGIVWNVGEPPVEGYSNFLSLVLARVFFAVGVDPLVGLKAIGGLSLLGAGALAYLMARRRVGPLAATIPVVLLTGHKGQILWAVTGLETSLYTFLVLAAFYALERALGFRAVPNDPGPTSRRWLICSAVLLLLVALTRPEGPLVGLAAGVAVLVHHGRARDARGGLRALLTLALVAAVPYALYFAWRWSTFHRLLPNSVYCKAGFEGEPWQIVTAFWDEAKLLVLVSLVTPWRRLDARHAGIFALTALYVVAMRGADPVLSFWNRYFLPVMALLAVTAAGGLRNIAEIVLTGVRPALRDVALVLAVLAWTGSLVDDVQEPVRRSVDGYLARTRARTELAALLSAGTRGEGSYVIGDAGLVPYLTDGHVIDAFCLNNAEATRPPIDGSTEKLVDRIFELAPKFIVVHSASARQLVPRPEHGAVYPALVSRPELAERYERVTVIGAPGDPFQYWVFRLK